MWLGKIIAGAIGFATAGIIGLIIGIIVGHYFDRGLANTFNPASAEQRKAIEQVFFKTTFLLMGKLAKADGRISEEEIALTERLMQDMGLHSAHKQEAIALFKQGATPECSISEQLQQFNQQCRRYPNLSRQLLNYLLSLALADGQLSSQEESLLKEIAQSLGIAPALFEQLLRMIRAQSQFRGYQQQGQGDSTSQSELATAYDALGVSPQATDSEVKKAYRKLMSENHPDKLMGQGVPEDMIKLATERAQEIQTAYDLISKHRKKS